MLSRLKNWCACGGANEKSESNNERKRQARVGVLIKSGRIPVRDGMPGPGGFFRDASRLANRMSCGLESRTMRAAESLLIAILFVGSLVVVACWNSHNSSLEEGGFAAEVTGAVTGKVSGPGLIRFLPTGETSFGARPGYFFIADDSGVRDLGVTFTIPAEVRPGTHDLVSAPPLDVGKEFEVRVDHSLADVTDSFERETEGTITIEAFPDSPDDLSGSRVKGSFQFSTRDSKGREIKASGSFDFESR